MSTATFTYKGDLRTEAIHTRSGESIITDAPTDNHGKGEAFSPTDLVGAALVTCMITVMGIKARNREWEMGNVTGEVKKIMASNPRRIAALHVILRFDGHDLSETERKVLENIAITCPVAQSLKADLHMQTRFEYD